MPKTLTRAQFKKLRPKGNYQKYLKYIRNNRPPEDPLMTQATALVSASLAPIKSQIEWAAKQRMQDALAASNAAKGFTKAFGAMTGPSPDVTAAAYQAAAAALEGAAGGVQGRAADIAKSAAEHAVDDVRRISGFDMPTPDATGALATPKALADIDASLYIGRAPLVRNTMASLNTAAKLSAANWADLQRFQGAREASDIRQKWLQEVAKKPELIQKAYLALREDRRQDQALRITQAELRLKAAAQRLAEAESKAEIAAAERELDIAQQELDAQVAGGYYDYYGPRRPGQSKGSKGLSASKLQQMAEARGRVLGNIVATTGEDAGWSTIEKWLLDKTTRLPRQMSSTYQRAVSLLTRHYWAKLEPLTKGMKPAKKEEVRRKMIKQIKALLRQMSQQYPQLTPGYKPGKGGGSSAPVGPVDTGDSDSLSGVK